MKKAEKLRLLVEALYNVSGKTDSLSKPNLKKMIIGVLEITDPHTIKNWKNLLEFKKLVVLKNGKYSINRGNCGAYLFEGTK